MFYNTLKFLALIIQPKPAFEIPRSFPEPFYYYNSTFARSNPYPSSTSQLHHGPDLSFASVSRSSPQAMNSLASNSSMKTPTSTSLRRSRGNIYSPLRQDTKYYDRVASLTSPSKLPRLSIDTNVQNDLLDFEGHSRMTALLSPIIECSDPVIHRSFNSGSSFSYSDKDVQMHLVDRSSGVRVERVCKASCSPISAAEFQLYDLEESFEVSLVHERELARPGPSSSVGPIPSVMVTLASPQIQSSPSSLPFTATSFAEARSRAVRLSCAVPELPVCTHSDVSPPFECVACEKQLTEYKAWYGRCPPEFSSQSGEETLDCKFREDFGYYDSGEHIDIESGALEVPVVQYPSYVLNPETVGEDRGQKVFLLPSGLALDPPPKHNQYRYSRAKGDDDLAHTVRPSRPFRYVQVAKRLVARFQRLVTLKLRSRSQSGRP